MPSKAHRQKILADAWIGDAVLTLYARLRILAGKAEVDQAKAQRFTSNQFLTRFGEPTAVEARIGRLYQDEGLDAAFRYIADEIEPHFLKQEAKLQPGLPKSS